jgi:DNA-binding NarL/FixJ family response regulator
VTAPAADPIRVVVVDDHQLVRTGFRIILDTEDDIDVVGEACDGEQAVSVVGRTRPDVVLMDVEMPRMDGLEATRRITAAGRSAVLILTTFDRDDYLFAALQAGASGFLLKNGTPEALIEAVRVLAAGDALLAPAITRRVIAACTRSGGARGTNGNRLADLTPREHEVLVLLAGGATNAEIATGLHLGETTVKTHVSRVLMKLGVRDRTQAVVFAYEHAVVRPGG